MSDFAGRVAFVTGAAGGIGRASALAFAARGATVLVTSHVLAELERFIDDIVIIGDGRVLSQTSLDQLPAGADLEAFYLSTLHTATGREAQS